MPLFRPLRPLLLTLAIACLAWSGAQAVNPHVGTGRALLGSVNNAPAGIFCANGTSGPCPIAQAAAIQCNFYNGQYWNAGAVQASCPIAVARNSLAATNLMPNSPNAFAYSTFSVNTARITAPYGLLVEGSSVNLLLNSATPATQTTNSLATGAYTLWVNGPPGSSATMSSGTGTGCGTAAATQGVPINFTITVAGTCTVTVAGTLHAFQLEAGAFGTSLILTTGSTATRLPDQVSAGSSILALLNGSAGSYVFSSLGASNRFFTYALNGGASVGGTYINNSATSVTSADYSGANSFNATVGNGLLSADFQVGLSWSAAGRSLVANQGTVAHNANTLVSTPIVSAGIGGTAAGGGQISGYVDSIAFFSSQIPDASLSLLTGGMNAGQLATLSKLKTVAAAAVGNNPVDLAPMTTPPTITQSATHNAALTVQANHLTSPASLQVSPGNIYDQTTSNRLYVGTSNWLPTGLGNIGSISNLSPPRPNTGETELYYRITFVTSSTLVEIQVTNSLAATPYRIIVNNQFVAINGIAVTSNPVLQLDLSASSATAPYTITLEVQDGFAFANAAVSTGQTIAAPVNTVVNMAEVGDSITEGISSGDAITYAYDRWAGTAAKQLGYLDRNAAVGGTGYVNTSLGNRLNLTGQIACCVSGYDVVFLAGGYNDNFQFPDATILTNAQASWNLTRAQNPNALIAIMGIFGESTGPRASLLVTEQLLMNQCIAWRDAFRICIPVSLDPTGAWIYGTGWVGHVIGDGNADTVVSADGVHQTRGSKALNDGAVWVGTKANTAFRAQLQTQH